MTPAWAYATVSRSAFSSAALHTSGMKLAMAMLDPSLRSAVAGQQVAQATLGACGVDLVRGHPRQFVPGDLTRLLGACPVGRGEHDRVAAFRGQVRLLLLESLDGGLDGRRVDGPVGPDLELAEVEELEGVLRVCQLAFRGCTY